MSTRCFFFFPLDRKEKRAYDKCIHFIHIKGGKNHGTSNAVARLSLRDPERRHLRLYAAGREFSLRAGRDADVAGVSRNLLSLPVLALLCQKQGGLRISRGALLETSLTGFFGCCITPILLFSSYRYLASGMATVFHFAYPVIVVLGGLVLRERVQKKALFCAVLCSLGILLLIDPSGAVDPLGVALALTSGVTYAVYILLLAHFRHREVMGFRMTFYMALISAVCMFFLCLFSHQLCLPADPRRMGSRRSPFR